MKIRFLILFILFSLNSIAQPFLGTWTSYLPYNKGSQVVIAENKIYCSTNGGLFYFNKSDNSLNKFSKENGLSDSDISALAYSEYNSCLLIAYKNSNIDLIKDNEIINIPDIMRKQILGDKNIYSVYFDKQFAYLSCGFGIVVLDTDNQEIKESYSIGGDGNPLKVNSLTISDSVIYAGTDEGLYFADLNNPNLIDFNNWSKDTRFSTGSNQIKSLGSFNSKVYISVRFQNLTGDSLLVQKDGQWERYPFFQNPNIRFLKANENGLLICSQTNLDIFDVNGNRISQVYVGEPRMADIDSEGLVWIADFFTGLIRFTIGEGKEVLIPEGPSGIEVFDLYYDQGKLRAVAGGATSSWANVYRWATIYSFSDNQWANWQEDSIRDLIKIISDPDDPDHYFAASWGYGLLEFQDEELINLYRENNSSLQSIIAGGDFFRLGGMDYDEAGNLWITNSGVGSPLSVLKKNGDWSSFEIGTKVNAPNMGDIIVSQFNHKWISLQGGNGLFVFNDNNSIENEDDDESIKLSIVDKNGDIITNEVYSIAEDRDGNIWVGTNQGPLVYYSPSRVFDDENFYAQQIIIPRNDGTGLGDPLLGTESISCIEVDGANRKWLGTKDGGVFLVSDDGLEEIHEFNTSNSPLLSNSIIDIAIVDETGEVFIATEKGIISFIGEATQPDDIFEDVYVFPNPVREDYFGKIVVSGLVEDSYVKITDLNANIVFETKSLGGQAIWDGTNFAGERVATGVYLVFCTTADGLQTFVTKLLFIH